MDIITLIIIILIIVISYKLLTNKQKTEQFKPDRMNNDDQIKKPCNEYDDPAIFVDMILNSQRKIKVNPHFSEIKFHQDYRDTANAFNLIVPNERRIFNKSDLPIQQESKPSKTETKHLITSFIKEVNKTIKNHVDDNINLSGWDDNMPEKKYKSGWEKQQQALGLPGSIYTDPAPKASIKLVKIENSEKYETDDEIKFVIVLIVQKRGVNDQMAVQINFVVDKRDWNLDRDFFAKNKGSYERSVQIEEISVLGFLSNNDFGEKTNRDNFYNFKKISDGKMFSKKDIIKELNKKRRLNINEMQKTLKC